MDLRYFKKLGLHVSELKLSLNDNDTMKNDKIINNQLYIIWFKV